MAGDHIKISNILESEVISDPRLGRRPQIDSRSACFPMCAMLPRLAYKKPRSRIWRCEEVLDQGVEGSCVGHGFAHELIARPYPIKHITHGKAVAIYKKAQTLDEWPGTNYSGTSVLAGAKAIQELYPGTIESYRWANNLQDVIATLGYHGPIVIGVNWYVGMYKPDTKGFIHVTGSIVGGHCLLLRGVDIIKNRLMLHNSWGASWGKNGTCWISFEDFDRLMSEGGDACIPIRRGWWKK